MTNFDGAGAGTQLPGGYTVQQGEQIIQDGDQIRIWRDGNVVGHDYVRPASGDGGNGGSGGSQTNLEADKAILDGTLKVAYQAYLDEKMRLIDLPMSEIEKDKLALARAGQEYDQKYKDWSMGFQQAEAARQGDQWLKSFGEQQRQFDVTLGLKEKELAQVDRAFGLELAKYQSSLSGDPNRIVESADFARRTGAARGSGVVIPEAYRAAFGDAGAAGGATAAGGVPAAYNVMDTRVTLSPEVNAARLGRPVAQFGNPTGTTAYDGTLSDVAATGWNARLLPQAYQNLSETGRAELAAVNQSLTGQRRTDLETDINAQLPRSRSALPSAYSNF